MAEKLDQRGPETADVGANPNAHQPRSQAFGAGNFIQIGLELLEFRAERPEVRFGQSRDLHGDGRHCGVVGEVDPEATVPVPAGPCPEVALVVERKLLLDVLGHLLLGLASCRTC